MTRRFLALIPLLLLSLSAAAGDGGGQRVVQLNDPAVVAALRRSDPARYEQVSAIVQRVMQQPDSDVPRWLRVDFQATDVTYRPDLLVSNPPKQRLRFTIEDTRYELVVTLDHIRVKTVPIP